MGNIGHLSPHTPPATTVPDCPGTLVGLLPADAPDPGRWHTMRRLSTGTDLDALACFGGGRPVSPLAPDWPAQALCLAPPIEVACAGDVARATCVLLDPARAQLERQADCVEYRATMTLRSDGGGQGDAGRSVMRVVHALGGLARDSASTPMGLRSVHDTSLLLALALMVPRRAAGQFLAKARAMAAYARTGGLRLTLTGPHPLLSFALHHDLADRGDAHRRRSA
jgi:hypothetical protein